MADWTAGYVADIGYTFGYYAELNPLRLQLAFLNAGLVAPERGSACELGFGQGVSANLHAAASVTQWFGTDFNPSQAGFAQELASVSGAGAKLFDASFDEFCSRTDLPDFDYIGLHGIWSWISDENRAVITDFIRRKLKVGGVVYISYNTQPGWASTVPLRDLLNSHVEIMGSSGEGIVSSIDGAIDFAERLLATNPAYAIANPQVAERIKAIKGQDRSYVAHEYFNRDWLPMSFSQMAEWLTSAKLTYACSANYFDAIEAVNLTSDQQAFLKQIPDAMFRETIRDFMVNQPFRKDYWVRGPRKLSALEQADALREHWVILVQQRADITLKVKGALGEVTMQQAIYDPILDVLADHQPKTLGQIEQAVKDKGISFGQIKEAALLLSGTGALHSVQESDLTGKTKNQTDRLNTYLCKKARGSNENNFLASPLTGGGISVGRFPQLFLLALVDGQKLPVDMAMHVWQTLALQGHTITKKGKKMETAEENIAELVSVATNFLEKQLPILKALEII